MIAPPPDAARVHNQERPSATQPRDRFLLAIARFLARAALPTLPIAALARSPKGAEVDEMEEVEDHPFLSIRFRGTCP